MAEMNTIRLEDIIQNETLQAMPQSAVQLLEISQQEDVGPNDLAVPIESDPGLAAQVLRFVNSSYFGFSRKVSSIPLAINLVGFKTIKNFTLWNALYSMIPIPKCESFHLQSLWQDSLRRAVFGRMFAHHCGLESAEEVFAGALMQDMAVPLLIDARPEIYTELLQRSVTENRRLSDLERETFGWDHAEIGAQCCERWNFPANLVEMIRHHTRPASTFDNTNDDRVISVCSLLPSVSAQTWDEQGRLKTTVRRLLPGVRVEQLFARTDSEFAKLAPSINMDADCKPLMEWLDSE